MSSLATDRRQGVNAGAAIKVPCRAATTANITLAGLQTIDGVALAADDRVLVKDQTSASENGIYRASTSAWRRERDWDGAFDVVKGTTVFVTDGDTYAVTWFDVTTGNPISPGETSVTITPRIDVTSAFMQTVLDDSTAAEARTTLGVYSTTEVDDALALVNAALALKATVASPTFTGTPAAPTAAVNTNTTQVATTAFVLAQAAGQNDLLAPSSTTKYISPGRLKYHPAAPKAWGNFDGTVASPAFTKEHNCDTALVDNGTGNWTVSFQTDLSDGSYAVIAQQGGNTAGTDAIAVVVAAVSRATTGFTIDCESTAPAQADSRIDFVVFGEH